MTHPPPPSSFLLPKHPHHHRCVSLLTYRYPYPWQQAGTGRYPPLPSPGSGYANEKFGVIFNHPHHPLPSRIRVVYRPRGPAAKAVANWHQKRRTAASAFGTGVGRFLWESRCGDCVPCFSGGDTLVQYAACPFPFPFLKCESMDWGGGGRV